MNTRSASTTLVIAALALTAFAGCYTKLMPFREAVEMRRASMSTSGGTTTGGINYTDNCTSCHSEAELADRASEVNLEDFYRIHGIPYDPVGFNDPYVQPPWWDPIPTIIYVPVGVGGGTMPVFTTGGGGNGGTTAPTGNPKRPRPNGSIREPNSPKTPRPRPDDPRPASPPTTASPTPTTTTPSAPPPTTSTPAPVIATPPAQNPPPPPADTRTRSSSGSEDTRTRKSGSGRE
jgi:hypothetical protein